MTHDKIPVLGLKRGRERTVLHGHPWIFSGAIESAGGGDVRPGVADVVDADGRWIARGLVNPAADLRVRVYSWNPDPAVDGDLLARRVAAAVAFRAALPPPAGGGPTDAGRLVYSEADGLSGLVVDRYGDVLSAQVSAAALAPYLPAIRDALTQASGVGRILFHADDDAVRREGIDPAALAAASTFPGGVARIRENGLAFDVDVGAGQKTGFFLDQRENRRRVAAYAAGRRALSVYCYTGAFEANAARAGAASILGIDSSEAALERARAHLALNGLAVPAEYRKADAPAALRRLRDEGRAFDLVILDPPRFVFTKAQKEKGLRAYKDINLLGIKLLAPGGILATFSCSGLVSEADFRLAVAWAASDAGRTVRILEALAQPADHPVLITFSESAYLKGLICRAD
jgi:23S rRNA (cytosine1962-C5)-methyltransferase